MSYDIWDTPRDTLHRSRLPDHPYRSTSEPESQSPRAAEIRTFPKHLGLFDSADGESGDEAIEEEVVTERHRQAGDEACRHQRSPVVNVATHQKNRNARPYHLIRFRREKRQSVYELLGDEGEGEDHHGENSRGGDRNHHLDESAKSREAVDHGRVFQFPGDRLEEAHEKPDGKRHWEAGINENQGPQRVLQAQIRDHSRQGNESQRWGK